jgi:hypothetical protein
MNLYQGKPAQKVQKSIIYFFKKIKKKIKKSLQPALKTVFKQPIINISHDCLIILTCTVNPSGRTTLIKTVVAAQKHLQIIELHVQ